MAKMRHHICLSINGALRNYGKKSMAGLLETDGKTMSDKEVRLYLQECLAKGWKKIPGGGCEGFDYFEHGCPGHQLCKECEEEIVEKEGMICNNCEFLRNK
jgi:hypothetical protein